MATPTYSQIQQHLISKAAKDDNFRKALLTDAKSAIAKELAASFPKVSGKLPVNLKINVVEETPNSVYLVLPAKAPAAKSAELDDAELEAVAGGQYVTGCLITMNNSECA